MKYFNFHTHNIDEKYGIINLQYDNIIDKNKYYSIGIHPWYAKEDETQQIDYIKKIIKHTNILAIGETGLDPKSKLELTKQITLFEEQANIAEINNKPIIIHCVKYYNELIKLKKNINPTAAWIIHGFNSKLKIAEELIKHNFYLSISEKVLDNKLQNFMSTIPLNKLLLETDNYNYNIDNIYKKVANIMEISLETLNIQIQSNIKDIGISL